MFDLTTEATLTLAEAAKLVPAGRGGKRTHLSTLLRWIAFGAKTPGGQTVRLEALRLGGRWVTSREALQRFAERLTPRLADGPSAPLPRTQAKRQKSSARAAAELEARGM